MLGTLGLLGWLLDVSALTTFIPGQPTMKPNTALGLIFVGIGGSLRFHEPPGRASLVLSTLAAVLVLALAVGTLTEYALGIDLRIDQLLAGGETGPYPGRPSPLTALALGLLAAGLLVFDVRPDARARLSEWLVLSAGFVAFIALLGFAFGAEAFYRLASALVTGVAVPTAVGLLLIAAGMLLERPHAPVMRLLASSGPGGVVLRRFVPAIVLAPLVLRGLITWLFGVFGEYDVNVMFATLVAALIVLGLALLFGTAAHLNRVSAVLAASREELRRAEERVKLALKGADLAAWDWNIPSGEVVFNRRWAEMRGFRPEEVRPHVDSWITGIHPEDLPRARKALDECFQGRAPDYKMELRVRTRSGDWIWILDQGKVFDRDERGEPTRMVGTELDITSRKRVEEQLQLAEARSSGILSISADAIISVDGDQRITMFNDGAEKIFGYSSSEVLGAPIDTLIPDRLRDVHRRHVEAFAASEMVARRMGERSEAIVGLRKNGEEFPADATISKLQVGSKTILTVSLRDMTVQKRLEEELRRALQARDDVLGIVAHDLRNPLAAIQMAAALLQSGTPEAQRPSRDPAKAIERSVARMNRLIQDLLDVTRMESGPLSIVPAHVRTGQLVADALDAQKALASSASQELRLDLAPDLPEVWADGDRLLQVFENLIGNASKFTGPDGRITVGAAPRPGEVLFWVADTGPGIPPNDVPHVFEPFWQARKDKAKGAGLGLPIVKGIVEAHNGKVWVESRLGRGSTFFFTIPTRAPADAECPEAAAA